MKKFNPTSKNPARAVQAWQILISRPMNRQTITYEGLSRLMYQKRAPGVLDKILGHIAYYCQDNSLPPLTAIVVGKARGTPGRNIPIDPATFDSERERVYKYDWYDVYPPSEEELEQAFRAHTL